ncbi:MAG: hypothetical protein P1U53_06365 [Sulfitobacter sp.]|nr:hypothetical protein [Sulfitobacter sp.]
MSTLGTALSVLMVGHSLFAFDGPAMLQSALRAGLGEGEVVAQITNGAPLQYNWTEAARAEGVNARDRLPEGGIGHLILTEAVPLDNHLAWSETGRYASAFAGLALEADPDARIWVQETWHSLKSGTGVAVEYDDGAHLPWRTRIEEDLPKWRGIVAEITATYPEAADQIGLIPAGQALGVLSDEIAAGRIEGLAEIDDLFGDDIHLNHRGHYFVAMVQYATLTGQTPLGLPTDFSDRWGQSFDTPDPELARQLQEVAWAAVESFRAAAGQSVAPPRITAQGTAPQVSRAPPVAPAAELLEVPSQVEITPGAGRVGIGLSAHKDWSTQVPFLDLMKSARAWIGHVPGQWGGRDSAALEAAGVLDAEGWPVEMPADLGSIGTLILTDMPEEAISLKGRYVLRYSGQGIIEVGGRATNVRYGKGEVRFDYAPGPGPVDIRIQRINRSDPPRITSIVKQEHLAAVDQGAIFNPDWLARMEGFAALRFMDWMETNGSTLARWEDRPKVEDATWFDGIPLETMIALANKLEVDAWFNIPHLADDDFVSRFAAMVEADLDPERRAYVEFSNEVWNWQFAQANWADQQGRARWNKGDTWMQYYGLRAAEVARLFSGVFSGQEDRLVNVISTQTGWLGLESEALEAPLLQAEGQPAPVDAFDAYAITGYFGGRLGHAEAVPLLEDWIGESLTAAGERADAEGLTGAARTDFIEAHRYDLARARVVQDLTDGSLSGDPASTVAELTGTFWPYHAAVARKHGLDLIVYEGGTHLVGVGGVVENEDVSNFMQHFNYSPEVASLYAILLEAFPKVGGDLYMHYADVGKPSIWGSWGALRHLDDENPRWDQLLAAQ